MTGSAMIALAVAAGFAGGVMNAMAGGGTFATLPALIALGLPANVANATSNAALLPGAAASAWTFRDELGPVADVGIRLLGGITFAGALIGGLLLAWTPTRMFDMIVPWLLLFAFAMILLGRRAADWLHRRVTIGARTLLAGQALLGLYGGYFGGGVGIMTTAMYGLLAGMTPRALFAPRVAMLAIANLAATIVFVAAGLVAWGPCLAMLSGAIAGGLGGARLGKRLPAGVIRGWTLLVTGATTIIFFARAYG